MSKTNGTVVNPVQQMKAARDEFARATTQLSAALEFGRPDGLRSTDLLSTFLASLDKACRSSLVCELGIKDLHVELAPIVDRLHDGDPRVRRSAAGALIHAKHCVRDIVKEFSDEMLFITDAKPEDIPF